MESNETGRDNTDNSSNMKEKKKTGTSARWKRRLKRKLRRFVRDIFAFFAVIVITSVIGAVIFSHIYTAGGQSYYDVVAHAIKAELDNPENGGFIGTATAAVQSSVKALNKVASHADTTNSDFSSIAGGGGSKKKPWPSPSAARASSTSRSRAWTMPSTLWTAWSSWDSGR